MTPLKPAQEQELLCFPIKMSINPTSEKARSNQVQRRSHYSVWIMTAFLGLVSQGCTQEDPPPNFVLITLDTTRPDHLGPYGYERAHTPNLDLFAESARIYERAYSTSSWTLASHASMLTGLLPREHGAQSMPKGSSRVLDYGVRPLSDSFRTLAEILLEAGYRTGAVVAGPALGRDLGTAQGFEFYEDEIDGPLKRWTGKRADETTDLALGILKQFGQMPFFLFINYFDPHAPYAPPADFEWPDTLPPAKNEQATPAQEGAEPTPLIVRYIEKLNQGTKSSPRAARPADELAEIENSLAGYDAEIAYLDLHLGRLLEAIKDLPNAENTWVIITSDHGESFGEHYFLSHGAHLYEDNVRVPLLVRSPGMKTESRISQPVQNHALFGSILDAAALPRPDWASLLPEEDEEREIMLEVRRSDANIRIGGEFFNRDLYSLVAPPFKLIRSSRQEVELFDLSQDPEELKNLYDTEPKRAAQLDTRLSTLLSERPPLYPEPENLELSKETQEALRAMGYIE